MPRRGLGEDWPPAIGTQDGAEWPTVSACTLAYRVVLLSQEVVNGATKREGYAMKIYGTPGGPDSPPECSCPECGEDVAYGTTECECGWFVDDGPPEVSD